MLKGNIHLIEDLECSITNRSAEPIYVVGFPKSGNTWLTRLLANVLQAPVRSGIMRGGIEIASEINQHLSQKNTKFEVLKVHYKPELFFDEIDEAPSRVVYIHRDFRDVVISAFFYWNNKYKEDEVQRTHLSSLITRQPLDWLKYYRNRRKLLNYIRKLCKVDIVWFEEFTGNWSQHIKEWRNIGTQLPDVTIKFVSYEKLLNDTVSTLLQIIHDLDLPKPSSERLYSAIKRQSFESLRKHFQELLDDDVPLGKEFNLKFLRKGVSGDWKNLLSPGMGKIIQEYHGEMLFDLGYESDPYWYKKV